MNQPIQNTTKVPKVVKPTNKKKRDYKTLETMAKKSPMSPPSLQKGSKYFIQVVLKAKLVTDPVKVYN